VHVVQKEKAQPTTAKSSKDLKVSMFLTGTSNFLHFSILAGRTPEGAAKLLKHACVRDAFSVF
jgi:hypothetical protein